MECVETSIRRKVSRVSQNESQIISVEPFRQIEIDALEEVIVDREYFDVVASGLTADCRLALRALVCWKLALLIFTVDFVARTEAFRRLGQVVLAWFALLGLLSRALLDAHATVAFTAVFEGDPVVVKALSQHLTKRSLLARESATISLDARIACGRNAWNCFFVLGAEFCRTRRVLQRAMRRHFLEFTTDFFALCVERIRNIDTVVKTFISNWLGATFWWARVSEVGYALSTDIRLTPVFH